MAEAPKAPWSPFPLVELCILVGLIMIVLGFISATRRGVLLGCGFSLVCLAAIELSVREHFAGYRSHSGLLAAVCVLVLVVALHLLTRLGQVVLLVAAILAFAGVLWLLRRAFARRSGGLGFRA